MITGQVFQYPGYKIPQLEGRNLPLKEVSTPSSANLVSEVRHAPDTLVVTHQRKSAEIPSLLLPLQPCLDTRNTSRKEFPMSKTQQLKIVPGFQCFYK